MREILFKGKRIDNQEWEEGYYVCLNGNEHRIYDGFAETDCGDFYPDWWKVDPATVGQFTGLTDKNGKRIFEGDIVAQPVCKYTVEFDGGAFFLIPIPEHNPYGCPQQLIGFGAMFEVIGNIHDNPELIGGECDVFGYL